MATVDGRVNVRLCAEPIRAGATVEGQNVLGSVDRDFLSIVDKIGGPFTPPGFYYKTFIRPRRLWPLYEKLLRNAAGLGKLDPHATREGRFDTEHRRVDVLVIGAGAEGMREAIEAAEQGKRVALVEEGPEPGGALLLTESGLEPARALAERARASGVEVLCPARAMGVYEGNLVPIEQGDLLIRMRAEEIVVAAGIVEQPLVFPGNDLVGVMLPGAVSRLVRFWSLKPGERAVIISADDAGAQAAEALKDAGARVAAAVDLREYMPQTLAAHGKKGHVTAITVDDETIACDLVVASGSPQPAHALLSHAGARVEYNPERGVFVPVQIPDGLRAVGSAAGELGETEVPPPAFGGRKARGKEFVCICEDQTTKDLRYAHGEGYDSIELTKRYTTVTMGPCQGRLCHLNSVRLNAQASSTDESAIGTTTARPPWSPISLELLAGRPHEPARRTSMHHRHKELGASMMWTGEWRRPYAYGDAAAEARAVHASVGIIDVSTLGKILVSGADAATFLERIYPNRFGDMKTGRIRYGVLTSDAGRIMDDGTIARLTDDTYYVTTTSTGAEAVIEWFEWWNAIWGYKIDVVNVTGALAAINVAGPACARADGARDRDANRRRKLQVPRRQARACRGRRVSAAANRLRRRARVRDPLPERARRAHARQLSRLPAPTSRSRPSGSSHNGSFGSRRATSWSARTPTPSRTCSRHRCPGSSSSTRTTSSAAGRPSTSRAAGLRRAWSASASRATGCPKKAGRSSRTASRSGA